MPKTEPGLGRFKVPLAPLSDMQCQPPPQRLWIIDRLLPEGVTILAGKPKSGTTTLALQLALAVATGQSVLRTFPTLQGYVLYLGLQDTPRRQQERTHLLQQGHEAPPSLEWTCTWNTFNGPGFYSLKKWLQTRPNPRLIVVDPLPPLHAPDIGTTCMEQAMLIYLLKELAETFHVSILLLYRLAGHTSRVLGVTPPTDANLVLSRPRNNAHATLHLSGYDLQKRSLPLTFDQQHSRWTLSVPSTPSTPQPLITPQRQEILTLLQQAPGPLSPKEIATTLHKERHTISRLLHTMTHAGLITTVQRGKYITIEEKCS